ncbi:MAG: hypothetical protein EBY26_00325 [Microbacteriaceae bacterium]|nr:hypothetical protein [Microbacteriaceae bacterium]
MATTNIGPVPMFPEQVGNTYERKMAAALPGQRGPLRFEEGVATDTDVPTDFQKGMMQGSITPPGRPNHNMNVFEKYPEETMAERAHVGSAAWVEAPVYLGEFAQGSFSDYAEVRYEEVIRSGGRQVRTNPAVVVD